MRLAEDDVLLLTMHHPPGADPALQRAADAGADTLSLIVAGHRFKAAGVSGLLDESCNWRPARLSEDQLKDLDAIVRVNQDESRRCAAP